MNKFDFLNPIILAAPRKEKGVNPAFLKLSYNLDRFIDFFNHLPLDTKNQIIYNPTQIKPESQEGKGETKMKTGTSDLPLHYGSAPRWLFEQMTKLAREISIILITEQGVENYLKKLANPNWFQALGCVLGFDWHSSGLTTTTCGAIKEGLRLVEKDLGIFVCGGKGKTSRKTPQELEVIGQRYSFDSQPLIYASKIAAKVDNNALQDNYQLYHHTFFVAVDKGKWRVKSPKATTRLPRDSAKRNFSRWAVVQQGMSLDKLGMKSGWARRYHWLSDNVDDFVNEPHAAIACDHRSKILNLVANESKENRKITAKVSQQKPEKIFKTIKKLQETKLPERHQVLISDINPQNLKKIFLSTYEQQPENFEKLLGMKGVGPKTIRALSLISELVYGASVSTKDPARFSFAHGGKDGTPYPVDRKTYNQSIEFLREAINKAKLGHYEKLRALKRLSSVVK